MNGEVDSFSVKARTGSDKPRQSSDGKYLSCPLPEEITDHGFEPGSRVYLKLESSVVDGEEIFFIRVGHEEIGRHRLKIRSRRDFDPNDFIRIPIEYTFHREGQSFYGLEKGDDLVVELDYNDNKFRIYRAEEYPARLRQLSTDDVFPVMKTPGIAGLGITELNQLLLDRYAEITSVPRQVSVGEEFEVSGSVQLPGLEKIVIQKRRQGAPGFTDVGTIEVVEDDEVVEKVPISLSERGVFELRLWVEYQEGSESSEVQEVEVV